MSSIFLLSNLGVDVTFLHQPAGIPEGGREGRREGGREGGMGGCSSSSL